MVVNYLNPDQPQTAVGRGIALVVILFRYALLKYELPQDIFRTRKRYDASASS